jgi:putative transposase
VKYAFMQCHEEEFRIVTMCRVLRAARSGYYAWRLRQRLASPRVQRRETIDQQVKQAFDAARGRSGSPRLVSDLRDAGLL